MRTDKMLIRSLGLASAKTPSIERISNWARFQGCCNEHSSSFRVVNSDTVKEIIYNNDLKRKTLALIFASAKNPGGGVRRGASAQEECFCSVTNSLPYLEAQKSFYEDNKKTKQKTYLDDALVVNNITIFFDRFCNRIKNEYCDAIFYPSPNRALCDRKLAYAALERRIKNILDYANYHKYEALVLGEWGCGVFGNDKNDLVSIISENVKKFGNKLNISFTVYNKEDVDFYQTAFSSILKD